MAVSRRWDMQILWQAWFSLGVHVDHLDHLDHLDPSITLHLPGLIIYLGRCKQPGFRRTN